MPSSIEKVGDYEIDTCISNKLGQGRFGIVFPGTHVETKKKVAAKYFSEQKDCVMSNFDQEADFLMKLRYNDNVVKILHYEKREVVVREKPQIELWMILEYCNLDNLSEFAEKHHLPMKKKIMLMRQSGCGLQYLHELKPKSIIHRDVKPDNILISGTAEMPVAKIADVGISKFYEGREDSLRKMTSGLGSPGYMAPELHSKTEETQYNKKVDVYSMGVTFWALLEQVAGCKIRARTIDGKTVGEVLWENRSSGGYKLDVDKDSDTLLQREVKEIIRQMIALDPADRPTIAEVVERLTVLEDALCDLLMVSTRDPKATWISKHSEWKQVAEVPAGLPSLNVSFCGVSTGIVGIGGGGLWAGKACSQCCYFSVLTCQWTKLENMPTARGLASSVTVSADVILVFGGGDENGQGSSACEKLDMKNNRWSQAADMPQPLCDPLVTMAQSKVYILPRNAESSEGAYQLQQYDPATDKYEQHGQPLDIITATDAQLTAVADTLLLFQTELSGRLNMQYNLTTKQWSSINPVRRFIYNICSLEAKDSVLLVCSECWLQQDSRHCLFEYDTRHHKLNLFGFRLPCSYDFKRSFVASISM